MLEDEVSRVLTRIDPVGLIAEGAPRDEYNPEVPDVTDLVERGEVSRANLDEVFSRWFYPQAVSEDILDKLTEALTSINHTRL